MSQTVGHYASHTVSNSFPIPRDRKMVGIENYDGSMAVIEGQDGAIMYICHALVTIQKQLDALILLLSGNDDSNVKR